MCKINTIAFFGFLVCCCIILIPDPSFGQGNWSRAYGGTNMESANCIKRTTDNGYIIAGYTNSFSAGMYDIWVLKLDSSGTITWQRTYGGSNNEQANAIRQTSDGGYIIAGYTYSFGAGSSDIWILKLTSTGTITWQRTYGGANDDKAYAIKQTTDGGYIVAGSTYSFGAGGSDIWILKLDSSGTVTWQETIGDANDDWSSDILQTTDGGYILAGHTDSYGAGSNDAWLIKFNSSGSIIWQKTYGEASWDVIQSIQQASDGGYIVAGNSDSFSPFNNDIWVVKLDSSGDITWQKTYGDIIDDAASSILQTMDGGYVIAGYTYSFGNGGYDIWVLKTDASGTVVWQKTYGGVDDDWAFSVDTSSDGGYIVAGYSYSFGSGGSDAWLLKMDASGSIDTSCTFITDTNVTAVDSTALSATSNSSAPATTVSPADTSITSAVSAGINTLLCEGSSAAPGAVPDNDNYAGTPLTISKSGSNLSLQWGSPGGSCVTQDYGIYRGTLPWTGYNHASIVCTTGGSTSASIAADSSSYYYLVVAQNGGEEGSYGVSSADVQRPAASSPCLPLNIGTCN